MTLQPSVDSGVAATAGMLPAGGVVSVYDSTASGWGAGAAATGWGAGAAATGWGAGAVMGVAGAGAAVGAAALGVARTRLGVTDTVPSAGGYGLPRLAPPTLTACAGISECSSGSR